MDGSPAVKRAKMEPMPLPTVVYESWNHEGLHKEMSKLKCQLSMLTEFVKTLSNKHNILLEDTATAMEGIAGGLKGQDNSTNELGRRTIANETCMAVHDQRIQGIEKAILDADLAARMQRLEEGVVRVVEHHVQEKLSGGMAETITEHIRQTSISMGQQIEQKVIESVGDRAAAQLTNLKIQQEGVEATLIRMNTEVTTHGVALEAMQAVKKVFLIIYL